VAEQQSLKARHRSALIELDRYKLLVESVEDYAIFLMDPEGYIQTWNKGAEKNKGWKADEIIGMHFSAFYQQEDIDTHKPERELMLARKLGRVEDEDWRVRKDGSKFWANVVITTLRDKTGEIVGFAKVTRDLTQRKHQEDTVRQTNVHLKRQQRELERLNESKDEFISLASHQLRTPATVIKQLLGMLIEGMQGDLPSDIRTFVEKAYESNERQIQTVNSLLKVAQLDAGKVVLTRGEVDIKSVLRDLHNEYKDVFRKREQQSEITCPQKATILRNADAEYLRMAVSNIVDNASKYTPVGGSVTVSLEDKRDDAVISISDTGVGMTEADIRKLFTKFVRIHNSLSQKVGGSGLGLYWAHKVIELHGGRIEVDSAVNAGTTFRIVLPKEGKTDA
jgi:PAS domain S-box-containing protein